MGPDVDRLLAAVDATWPAAAFHEVGPWLIREGQGGGKRVSAATARQPVTADKLPEAEAAMRDLGQHPLFLIRPGEAALDQMLDDHGYAVVDPVNIRVAPVTTLTDLPRPAVTSFAVWEPLAVMNDIWEAGGIGPGRRAVMARACGPKTGLFGRSNNRPAATGFAAIHDGIAMVHALEVLARHRREGMGRYLTLEAARWASDTGARHIAALCTRANAASNALFASLGMTVVGTYHYRQKE